MKTRIEYIRHLTTFVIFLLVCSTPLSKSATVPEGRARARDIGIQIGIYEHGTHNAITDVPGVKVGHTTLNYGDNVRTGVTAIIPQDDIWENRLFGAAYVINGNGEATGISWVNEAGWI